MRARDQLISDAAKFSEAQRTLAGRSREDSEHWHHVAIADLLDEMATMLRKDE